MTDPLLNDRFYYLHLVRGMKGGQITIGSVEPYANVGIALCSKQVFAALKWQSEETVDQLMKRLDDAVCEAMRSGGTVNELGAQIGVTASRTRRRPR